MSEGRVLSPVRKTRIGFYVLEVPWNSRPDFDFEAACQGMDESEIQTELLRNWAASSGMRVYPEFKSEIHVAPEPLEYDPDLPLHVSFDWGLSPAACIGQLSAFGQLQIFPSLHPEERQYEGVYDFASKVADHLLREYAAPHGMNLEDLPLVIVGDPAGRAKVGHSHSGKKAKEMVSCFDVLYRGLTLYLGEDANGRPVTEHLPGWGWRVIPGDVSNAKRQEAVRYRLKTLIHGEPAFLLDPREEFIEAAFLGGYHYQMFADGTYGRDPEKNESSHCLTGETLIETSRGQIPIRDVTTSERVMTRLGWRRVTASWCVGRRSVVEVLFSDGRTIYCTPEHKIWSDGRWTEAGRLRYNQVCEQRRWSTTDWSTLGIRMPGPGPTGSTSSVEPEGKRDGFTWCFGWRRTAQSRPDGTSITKTGILTTTPWPTWCACLFQSIAAPIKRWGPTRPRWCGPIWTPSDRSQPSGTVPRRDTPGTLSMDIGRLLPPRPSSGSANAAASNTSRGRSTAGTNTAVPTAAPPLAGSPASTTRTGSVLTAERSLPSTDTHGRGAAPLRVLAVRALTTKVPVYDLTVDEAHEFYANGVLVHNCINALEYLATRISARPLPPKNDDDEDAPRREPFCSMASSRWRYG